MGRTFTRGLNFSSSLAASLKASMVFHPHSFSAAWPSHSPTSQPGFLASLEQEEGMQSTHKKPTPCASRRKYQFPIAAWQHEACHAFSIPQSLLLLSLTQLTHRTPRSRWQRSKGQSCARCIQLHCLGEVI